MIIAPFYDTLRFSAKFLLIISPQYTGYNENSRGESDNGVINGI